MRGAVLRQIGALAVAAARRKPRSHFPSTVVSCSAVAPLAPRVLDRPPTSKPGRLGGVGSAAPHNPPPRDPVRAAAADAGKPRFIPNDPFAVAQMSVLGAAGLSLLGMHLTKPSEVLFHGWAGMGGNANSADPAAAAGTRAGRPEGESAVDPLASPDVLARLQDRQRARGRPEGRHRRRPAAKRRTGRRGYADPRTRRPARGNALPDARRRAGAPQSARRQLAGLTSLPRSTANPLEGRRPTRCRLPQRRRRRWRKQQRRHAAADRSAERFRHRQRQGAPAMASAVVVAARFRRAWQRRTGEQQAALFAAATGTIAATPATTFERVVVQSTSALRGFSRANTGSSSPSVLPSATEAPRQPEGAVSTQPGQFLAAEAATLLSQYGKIAAGLREPTSARPTLPRKSLACGQRRYTALLDRHRRGPRP